MNSSKKYEYHPLTLATSFHSMKLLVRMLLKAPEVILGLILTYLFPPFAMPFIIAALLLYGYCKEGFIEEHFFDKENWVELKLFAATLIILLAVFIIMAGLVPSPTTPLPQEHHQESPSAPVVNALLDFLLGVYFTYLVGSLLLDGFLDVYHRYNGGVSGKQALFNDANMCKLSCMYLLIFMFLIMLTSPRILFDTDVSGVALNLFAFLTSLFFINTYLCHFYTPEIPKVTVTELSMQK